MCVIICINYIEPEPETPNIETEPEPTEPVVDPSTDPEPTEPEPEPTIPAPSDADSPVLTPVENSGITINEAEKIAEIAAGLDAAALTAELRNENIAIRQADGSALPEGSLVGTGCKVQVLSRNGELLSEYEILVPMDVSGDGKITSSDARTALRSAVNLQTLQGVYSKAADANGDTQCTTGDARAILRKAVGLPA